MPSLTSDELDISPSDVVSVQVLKRGKNSVVFKVLVNDQPRVLKVYHDRGPSKYDPPYREVNLFVCESTAYRRLKARGFCERRVIPDFYGVITRIQPALWPSLHMFLHDKLPPNAILIEYIPNLHQIDLANFSEDRVKRLRQILDDMHQAQVLHHDAWPRNMCVSESQDRVLWIDFDSAQTFSEERPITDRHKLWFDREVELVEDFLSLLPKDYEEGRLNHTYNYYYE